MRVALVSRAASPFHGHGGLERHVAALFEHLRRAGCEVTLFTTPPERPCDPPDGVRFVPYGGLPWPKRRGFVVLERDTNYLAWSLRAGRRVLEDANGFDVVQADGGAAFGYAYARAATSAPLVLHPHGMEEFKAPSLKRTAYLPLRSATRFAARRAARVLAPDRAMKSEVAHYLGIDEAKVAVIPNAIDLAALDAAAANAADLGRFGIPVKARVLLSVGRLEANKGFDVLARAIAELHDLDFTWVLVGRGPMREKLEGILDETGSRNRVVLAGAVTDEELAGLYQRATIFVHPTLFEGSSMVTLEAMAHRRPVVATSVGGIPDKVIDGESGRLVPPGDAAALASAVRDVLRRDDAILETWGERARSIAEERFDWAKRSRELIALYESLR